MAIKHLMLALTGENDQASLAASGMHLAKSLGAHVAGCYEDDLGPIYTTPIDMVMPPVNYGAFYDALQDLRKQREAAARKHFETAAAVTSVPLVSAPSDGRPSAMWTARKGGQICGFDVLTDLVVVGSPGTADSFVTWNVLEHALFAARRRVLVVPAAVDKVDFSRPLIAWNGSHEAENAVERALDLLPGGATVGIVQAGHLRPGRTPVRQVIDYLHWHGFKTEFEDLGPRSGQAESLLLHHATTTHASCIVMGAFTHSRTRELILGGVTEFMLRHAHIPLLMAH